ncbi:hypothetical protein TSUD_290350 [Trifolium subterraneum]|uniref:Reverse transcriptase domain-containing protein n=1 Tax=Trifolium subterraneum TaxID=3900 RepID=A0A2Z6MTH4_TRISU|nr:hypothetical protein TSUD_290350 [Trifolium subterraneum]
MSRLDRFLLSEEWCLTWPNCIQVAQLRGLSDHCPLVLEANEENLGPQPSRMLKCWKDISGYQQFVRDKWSALNFDGWGGFVLKEKFKMIKLALKEWHKTHSQNLPSKIDSLKVRLSVLEVKGEEEALAEAEIEELHEIMFDIHSLYRRSASICWQQSRALWLKKGDANSKYFHLVNVSRRRGNAISSIQVDGVATEGVQPIRQAVLEHFASHFKARNVDRPGVENLHFRGLTMMEGGSLTKPFSLEEGLNSTFIALIPKVDNPQHMNDCRPISLVGSLYKIMAKVLANRLRLVIGSAISESRTAFVHDRQILDGILIENEAVDEARRTKKELMLFKVDFEKAYDSVDWGYLDVVMVRISFMVLWRKWMKECICTTSASVLVNGSPTEEFPLERGLRQGDPLSPFMFLLAAEGLHVLMQAMIEHQFFSGYSFGMQNPIFVSHLQFVDDTLLLGTKSWANVRALRAALVLFETMSSLKVNFNKSMLVGVNIADSWLRAAASALRFKVGKGGNEETRKTSWISWNTICLSKENGGLGVKRLREFNTALLGKWCWRMLVGREELWFKVLATRYGVERGCVREGGRSGSFWWREIVRIRDGVGGGWFQEGLQKRAAGGTKTFFWTDPWLGWTSLCERFGRLFELAVNKSSTMVEMISLGWDIGGEPWEWRRQLGYSVRGAYQLLTSQPSYPLDTAADLIWHKQVALKVSIFAWRLLRDRLSTKSNLVTRGIITPEAQPCVAGDLETAQHLFISYSFFGSLWSLVRSWIDLSLVDPQNLVYHFLQFTFSSSGLSARRSLHQLIWLLCVWVIWNERNQRFFRNSEQSLPQFLNKVKLYSYW